MKFTAQQIAEILNGEIVGDSEVEVNSLAKIEEGENNSFQKINSWTIRSEKGAENNIWICKMSHKQQDEWTSVSYGGYFNSLVWKQPSMLNQIKINIDNDDN